MDPKCNQNAAVFYSSEIFSSWISTEFAGSVVPESNISFYDKLDFTIDPLCRVTVDVVLGRERINVCTV